MKRTAPAALAAILGGALLPTVGSAAFYYEAVTVVETDDRGGRTSSTARGWIDGANARIELSEGDPSGMMPAGSYLITNDGGATLHLVNPHERTIAEVDLAGILSAASAALDMVSGMMQMEFTDFTSEQLSRERGDTILGYPTQRYRYQNGYTMRISVFGMRQETRTETEHDIMCTDAIDARTLGAWVGPDRLRTGNENIDRLLEQQFADLDCTPLRVVSVSSMSDGRGRPSATTTTMEVTQLRQENAPANAFTLPADYERVSLLPEMPDMSEFSMPDMSGSSSPDTTPAPAEEERSRRRPRLRDLLR